jgi:hypothetical protein
MTDRVLGDKTVPAYFIGDQSRVAGTRTVNVCGSNQVQTQLLTVVLDSFMMSFVLFSPENGFF